MKKNPHRHLPLSPSKREMIYKLHSEGLYDKAIAVKIGIPTGEESFKYRVR